MIDRLAEDHANARRLAEALAEMDGIVSAGGIAQPGARPRSTRRACATNFVLFRSTATGRPSSPPSRRADVVMVAYPHGQVRAVTHYGVTAADIEPRSSPTRRRGPRARPRRQTGRRAGSERGPAHGSAGRQPRPGSLPARPRRARRRRRRYPMTDPLPRVAAPSSRARGRRRARSTTRFYDLVEARFRRLLARQPGPRRRTLGIHTEDDAARRRQPRGRPRRARRRPRAPRRGRGARPGRPLAGGRASSATSRSTTSAARIFDADESSASGSGARPRSTLIGDALFLLFARDHAPLPERLDAIAGRLEAAATYLEEAQDPARRCRRSGSGSSSRSRRPASCRSSSTRSSPPATASSPAAEQRRLERASESAKRRRRALRARGSRSTLADGDRRLAARRASATTSSSGCGRSTASTPTRSSRSAGSSSAEQHAARRGGRPRDRPGRRRAERHRAHQDATTRRRSRRRSTAYRDAMLRARAAPHRARPRRRSPTTSGSTSSRRPSTCATSSRSRPTSSRRVRRGSEGHLHRHPVGRRRPERDARAQLRSISNTSIHEAYPGHHLQLDDRRAATRR